MAAHQQMDPSETGYFDCDRTTSGSAYHERMVQRDTRRRTIIIVAVLLALILAICCAVVASQAGSVG